MTDIREGSEAAGRGPLLRLLPLLLISIEFFLND